MTARSVAPRPRLTGHQAQIFRRLAFLCGEERRWLHWKHVGSIGALRHLQRKGYVECDERTGPLGGLHPHFRPTAEARARIYGKVKR